MVLAAMLTALAVTVAPGAAAREPSVRPGGILATTSGGFAPHAVVTERFDRERTVHRVRADRHGRVAVRVRVPVTLGRHRLVLVGRVAVVRSRPTLTPGRTVGDVQVLQVEIPRVAVIPFRVVRGGAEILGVDTGRDPGADAGPLAATGSDLREPVVGAVLMLLVGAALSVAGARRERDGHPAR